MNNVPVPKELHGSFVHYGQIIKEERSLFWQSVKRVAFVGLPLAFLFLFRLGPRIGFSGSILVAASLFVVPCLPAINLVYRQRNLRKTREWLEGYFTMQRLRICHDLGLRVSVVRD